MEPIGTVQPVTITPAPVVSVPSAGNTQPVILPTPAPTTQPAATDQVNISAQAEQQQPAQPKVQYANPQVLGTTAVTMYMVNGQLYTRYRDEVTNKVTYIPEEAPVLGGSSGNNLPSLVNITA